MNQWIDFKQLRSRLKFSEVLAHYNVRLSGRGDQAQGVCPLPTHKGERRSPSLSVNLRRGVWRCFGCGAKGNVLDFAIYMEGLSPDRPSEVRRVALLLAERFKIEGCGQRKTLPANHSSMKRTHRNDSGKQKGEDLLPPEPVQRESCASQIRINEPLDFELKGLQPNHPYLTRRGFLPDTVRHFGLGYCARGLMANRIAIPLHDTEGRLVGYAGRIVDDSKISEEVPKYKLPSKRQRNGIVHEFHTSHLVYNANRIKGPVDHLVVVGGFPPVWWLHQLGVTSVVALIGSSCSPTQAAIILAKTSADGRVSLMPDGNDEGERWAPSVIAGVGTSRWVRRIVLSDGRRPTDCELDDVSMFLRG